MLTTPEVQDEKLIRTEPCPACILCGSKGAPLRSGLADRIFGAYGSWDLKKCPSADCQLIWLDPMPKTEDLGKAYANYYTHGTRASGRGGRLKQIYTRMRLAYWAAKYQYRTEPLSLTDILLGKLLYFFPFRRITADEDVRLLPAVPGGRLLDVGCGSGDWLVSMRELGWNVEGLDFDENAVKVARERGLAVQCGSLEQQGYPDASFDAVVLYHVIEHVPDPVATLAECRRILKPGGRLAVFTPNGSSLSHQVFKQDWRGLEPPRHLHIFSMESLGALADRVGFRNFSILPRIASSVIYESVLLRRGWTGAFPARRTNRSAGLWARTFNLAELFLLKLRPGISDCVAAIAVK